MRRLPPDCNAPFDAAAELRSIDATPGAEAASLGTPRRTGGVGTVVRQESRGAHSRVDFPKYNDEVWGKVNSVISVDGSGEMQLGTSPLPQMPEELRKIVEGGYK